jgi:RES domain-containing protein
VTIHRICSSQYPKNDGEGARRFGGRWNHKGTALVYCAETTSLCALEVLANSAALPIGMVMIVADVPDSLAVRTINEIDLPAGWQNPMPLKFTKDLGTKWAGDKATAVLSVPSAVVPHERNFLLNPKNVDFGKIRFHNPEPFVFDPRRK